MKKGWPTKTLGDLCDVLDYKRKPITKRDRIEGEYPYYGATGVLGYVEGYLFDEPLVLVGEDGAKWESGDNTAFAVEGKIWVNNHAHVLRPHRTQVLDNWLIYHLNHSDLLEFVSGLTVPKLNQGSLREIPIPIPPVAEQQRIVGLLDEAFAGLATAKAHAEKNLQNARALFESHLQSVFTQRGPGWVKQRLETLAGIRTGKRDANHQVENGPYPFYTCAFGQFKSPTFSFDGPSIILPGNGANVGKVFFHDGKFEAYQRTYVVNELSESINPRFLYYCFSGNWPGWIANKQFGSATNYIVVGDLKAFPVSTPPLPMQVAIVEQLELFTEETQRLATLYTRKLAALEALKKSLLHQAFTGAL